MKRLLGVVHYALFPAASAGTGDITATLEPIVCDQTFGAVEITWVKDASVRRDVAQLLKYAGVQVMFSGGPPLFSEGYNLSSTVPAERKKAVEFTKQLIDMAYELGARNLLIGSGPDPGRASREAAIEAFLTSVDELCTHAIQCSPDRPLVICLETFDQETHWRQLLGPTAVSAATMARARQVNPNCGLTLDMSHVAQLGEDLTDAVRDAGECLIHAHIANAVLVPGHPLYGDMHPHFFLPEGSYTPADIPRFLRILEETGFYSRPCPYGEPVVSLEVKPQPFESPLAVLAGCKRYLGEVT